MRELDREIKSSMRFDYESLKHQMNNAFEGRKEAALLLKRQPSAQEPARKESKALEPILEESKAGTQVALCKPNMTLGEQRKLKNEELKKRVKQMTEKSQANTEQLLAITDKGHRPSEAQRQEKATFITGTRLEDLPSQKRRAADSDSSDDEPVGRRAESPTAMAARALALMNKQEDEALAVAIPGEEGGRLEDVALAETEQLEREMNEMFRELSDMESMIQGNKDLKSVQGLMDSTKDVVGSHIKAYDKLKTQIL